jgi:hypothetical protein
MDAGYQITAAWMPPLFPVCCNPCRLSDYRDNRRHDAGQSARLGICCMSAAITIPGNCRVFPGKSPTPTAPRSPKKNITDP